MHGGCEDLIRRVRLSLVEGRLELGLDGWPLLVVDDERSSVRINDLRSAAMFDRSAPLPAGRGRLSVRTGAVGDEIYVLFGDVAAAFVVPDDNGCPTHAEVKVVESATGRLLLDCTVRYRQLPAAPVAKSPVVVGDGG